MKKPFVSHICPMLKGFFMGPKYCMRPKLASTWFPGKAYQLFKIKKLKDN